MKLIRSQYDIEVLLWGLTSYTSPSGEKLKDEMAVATTVSDAGPSRVGSPGGALASRTFIFTTLHCRTMAHKKIQPLHKGKYLC